MKRICLLILPLILSGCFEEENFGKKDYDKTKDKIDLCKDKKSTTKNKLWYKIRKGMDVAKECTSEITDFSKLFYNQEEFNQDLSRWDVSNSENFAGLFDDAKSFDQDLSVWNI